LNYLCTALDKRYWDPWGVCWLASLREIALTQAKLLVFDYGLTTAATDLLQSQGVEVIKRNLRYVHRFDALSLMIELSKNSDDKFAYYDADVWFQNTPDAIFDYIDDQIVLCKNKNLGFYAFNKHCLNNFSYFCTISQFLREDKVFEKFVSCYDSCLRTIDNKFNCIELPNLVDIKGELCIDETPQVAIHPFNRLKGMSLKKNLLFQERYYDLYKKYLSSKNLNLYKTVSAFHVSPNPSVGSIFKRPSQKTLYRCEGDVVRIDLPEMGSFNGSFLDLGQKYLCVYRPDEETFKACFLNRDFSIIQDSYFDFNLKKVSDPRLLITPNNQVLLSYSQSVDDGGPEFIAANIIMDLNLENPELYCGNQIRISPESVTSRQKNWILFTHENEIYAIASICPHEIYKIDLDAPENIEKLYSTNWRSPWFYKKHHRGSTNVVPLPNGNYLSTFHTAALAETNCFYYDNGAYIFEGKPPFAPLYASDKSIMPAEFATEPHFRKEGIIKCIFPVSMSLESNKVHIGYGDNDSAVKILSTTVDELTKTLVRLNKENTTKRKPSISVILHTASDDSFLETHGVKSYFYSLLLNLSYQTFTDFELIYVDAFYEENKQKFEQIVKHTPFVVKHVPVHKNHRYWHDQNHTFISAAKNTGILYADGELLISFDDAEFIERDLLQKYWGYYNLNLYLLPFHKRFKTIDVSQSTPIFPLVGDFYCNDHRVESCEDKTLQHQFGAWAYAGTCFSLEDALSLNGFNERMDGCKSLEDCDFGVRLTLLGKQFICDKTCYVSIVDHQFYCDDMDNDMFKQSDRQKGYIEPTNIKRKPLTNFIAVENYGVLMLAQELHEIKANSYPITDKHLEIIRRETLKYRKFDPLDENNQENLQKWLNTPVFDLKQERDDLRNSPDWIW